MFLASLFVHSLQVVALLVRTSAALQSRSSADRGERICHRSIGVIILEVVSVLSALHWALSSQSDTSQRLFFGLLSGRVVVPSVGAGASFLDTGV